MRFPVILGPAAALAAVGSAVLALGARPAVPDLPSAVAPYLRFDWAVIPALALVALLVTGIVYGVFAAVRLTKLPAVGAVPSLASYGWGLWLGWFLTNREPRFTPVAVFIIDRFSAPIFWGSAAALAVAAAGAALSFRNRKNHA